MLKSTNSNADFNETHTHKYISDPHDCNYNKSNVGSIHRVQWKQRVILNIAEVIAFTAGTDDSKAIKQKR